MWKPLTGEPYAGNPPVRFGGRGGESLSYPLSAFYEFINFITYEKPEVKGLLHIV